MFHPATPKVRFDYSAEGWQASRIAELQGKTGTLDLLHAMYWERGQDVHVPGSLTASSSVS